MNDLTIIRRLSPFSGPPQSGRTQNLLEHDGKQRMNKTIVLALLTAGALMLNACGAAPTSSTSGRGGFRNNSTLQNRPLAPEAKLALGTIKLEGTPQAVGASEAAKLLPLWQLMAQLNGSSSTAPQEVTAVLNQIEADMDPAQVKAIGGMQLTAADVFASFQQGGIGSAASGGSSLSGSTTNRSGQRGGGAVFFGGGGFPGGGGGFGASRTGTTANGANTAASAAQAAQQLSNQISTVLVNQLVQLLAARVKT